MEWPFICFDNNDYDRNSTSYIQKNCAREKVAAEEEEERRREEMANRPRLPPLDQV